MRVQTQLFLNLGAQKASDGDATAAEKIIRYEKRPRKSCTRS